MATELPTVDVDAERALIAACLASPDSLDDVRLVIHGDIPADVFFDNACRRIWSAMIALSDEGRGVDLPSVARALRDDGRLEEVGGTVGLSKLLSETPAVASVTDHAKALVALYVQRHAVQLCAVAVAEGKRPQDAKRWVQSKADALQDAVGHADASERPELEIADLVSKTVDEMTNDRNGVVITSRRSTGFRDLDRIIGGWHDGNTYLLGGRPGMGKTSFALCACLSVAERGDAAMFLGYEMPAHQLVKRAIAVGSGCNVQSLMDGSRLPTKEWEGACRSANVLAKLPIFIGYRPDQTVGQLRGTIRRQLRKMRQRHGEGMKIGLIAVDYVQLIPVTYRTGRTRENEVSEVSAALKRLADEFCCPILVLSQLSRDVEKRTDKRPTLPDLRESGSLEQDAYGVLFAYRDEYYYQDSQDAGMAEIIVAKHRNGKTGTAKLLFHGESTRFDDVPDRFDASGSIEWHENQ